MLLRVVKRDRPLQMHLRQLKLPGPETRFSRAMVGAREESWIFQVFRKPQRFLGELTCGAEPALLNVDLEEIRQHRAELMALPQPLTEIARSLERTFPLRSAK